MFRLERFSVSNLQYVLMLLFSFLIPISDFLSLRVLIVLLVLSIVIKGRTLFNNLKQQTGTMIYFVVLLLGLIYTENLTAGIGFIETNASLIILPLAFPVVGSLDKSRWRNLINAFILGLVVACLACLSYSAYNYGNTGDKDYFFYYNFTKLLGAHPTYYAYYIIFSITWIYYTIFFNTQSSYPVLRYVGVVFLFFVLLLTGGQTSFISLLFCFSFFILKFILESKNSQKNIVIIGIILMLAVMFIYSLNMSDSDMNDSWDRFNLWEAAIHSNTNPVLGEGTGDNRDVLNDYYKSHHMAEFANSNMNSHNQFIQTYVSNGILGLVSILILLMSPIYRSFKMASSLGILIFFPFLLYGITEVIMGRYQGVVFFALLNQVFLSIITSTQEKLK